MALEVLCQEHLARVREFAKSLPDPRSAESLEMGLDRLAAMGASCRLGEDWAPHSFSFAVMRKDGKMAFNGGLIYDGPGSPCDGSFPAFCVSFGNGRDYPHWGIHT